MKLTRYQKQVIKSIGPAGEMEFALRAALVPATRGALTREEAETLIWTAVRAMRQGSSIDYRLPTILDEMFKPAARSRASSTWADG